MRDEYRADFDEGRGGFGKQLLQKIDRETLRAQRHTAPSGAAASGDAGIVEVAGATAPGASGAPTAAAAGDIEMKLKPL